MANVVAARPGILSDQVTWTSSSNGGAPLTQSVKYIATVRTTQVNLTITSLTMADSGVYTVTIVHEAGTASLEFLLEVLSKCK